MFKISRFPIATSLVLGLILVASASFVAGLYTLWMTTILVGDAAAVNTSGSLRMQSYRIAFAIEEGASNETLQFLLDEFSHRLTSPELKGHIPKNNQELSSLFNKIEIHFAETQRNVLQQPDTYLRQVDSVVDEIDRLVALLEQWSEAKISRLRQQQVILSFVTFLAASFFALVIFNRVVSPLQILMHTVQQFSRGNKQARSSYLKSDEFGELSATFNRMTEEITDIHASLEFKIDEQTQELSRNNQILEFLFNLSQSLSTEAPDIPELKQQAMNDLRRLCSNESIFWTSQEIFSNESQTVIKCSSDRSYLVCTNDGSLPDWQQRIMDTVGDLFDNAINRIGAHKNESRIALLSERSAIARELHDSLAQQLSYLKIQVVRWIKLRERNADEETLNSIVTELREGLNSSYRKLRELLVTFRAQTEEMGLVPAVNSVADEINRISQNTKIHLYIDDQWPEGLSPSQEIHCQHVIREALTNVIKHAKAENAVVSLQTTEKGLMEIKINDDGIGFGDTPEKPMHYGLKIMAERAERIGGTIDYCTLRSGGAGVKLTFKPEYKVDES